MADLKARVWITGDSPSFPEQSTPLMARTSNTGLCFSGGGTRAMAAGIGQLRALRALGLLDRVRYISAVSGGGWATAPLLFSTGDEGALLGPVSDPATISMKSLENLGKHTLGHLATKSLRSRLIDLLGDVDHDRLWIDAVGLDVLAPLGLFDRSTPSAYALDAAAVADIKARNPQLADRPFATVRPDRPFWIGNGCIIGPKSCVPLDRESPASLEFTPMYTGSPRRLDVTYYDEHDTPHQATIGGGYVEAFAFGGPAPTKTIAGVDALPPPHHVWGLADSVGVSSSAFAGWAEHNHLIDSLDDLAPVSPLWAVPPAAPAADFALGDGGILENYGIIPLILRGVEHVVVFVNTGTRLHPTFHETGETQWKGIDSYLPALFGYRVTGTGVALQNNHVFEQAEFQGLIDDLTAARAQGGGVLARRTFTTVQNDWWGVPAGRKVDVAWVYNDRVSDWEHLVHDDVREAIEKGNGDHLFHGPLESFPNYATMGQNTFDIVELTDVQVNALAELTCWTVMNNRALFEGMLR